jgi:LytS/YehU family sensor histidine kinase
MVSFLLRYVYQKIGYNFSISKTLVIVFIGSLVFANIWYWLVKLASWGSPYYKWFLQSNLTFEVYCATIFSDFFVLFLWSAFYFGINFWYNWTREKEKTLEANMLAQKAQLEMLRYQLHPHFFFNSLNTIKVVIEEDQEKAKLLINQLSEFIRYSLLSREGTTTSLAEELIALKNYLAIEKTRYEEKLEITIEVDPEAEKIRIPCFLIHPLIENAIKYGMKTSPLPLKINFSASIINQNIVLELCNSGSWIESNEDDPFYSGTGIGLKNVQLRLENAFPSTHKFEIIKKEQSVCIKISIEYEVI